MTVIPFVKHIRGGRPLALVDIEARLAGYTFTAPRRDGLRTPTPFRTRCRHFLVDCRIDTHDTCSAGHVEHPGRECVLCCGVVDLVGSDRTVNR